MSGADIDGPPVPPAYGMRRRTAADISAGSSSSAAQARSVAPSTNPGARVSPPGGPRASPSEHDAFTDVSARRWRGRHDLSVRTRRTRTSPTRRSAPGHRSGRDPAALRQADPSREEGELERLTRAADSTLGRFARPARSTRRQLLASAGPLLRRPDSRIERPREAAPARRPWIRGGRRCPGLHVPFWRGSAELLHLLS